MMLHFVEVSHADFSEISGMVLVEIGPVMMLATCQPTSTGMLSVLANAAVTSGDMPAAGGEIRSANVLPEGRKVRQVGSTYCLRVLLNLVGIVATERLDNVLNAVIVWKTIIGVCQDSLR